MDARIVGEAVDHDGLVAVLRARKDALQLSDKFVDQLAGLADGHTGKILGRTPVRTLGSASLTGLLGALGVKLIVVEDAEQSARIGRRWEKRTATHAGRPHPRVGKEAYKAAMPLVMSEWSRKANAARWGRATPEHRAAVVAALNAARAAKRNRPRTTEAA
jgi:hypothetical protein